METLATVPVIARRKLAFAYDAMGRRIRKTTWTGTSTGTWQPQFDLRFLHEPGGWNILAEITADSKFLRTYTWGTDLSGSLSGAGGVGGLLFTNIHHDNSIHANGMDLNGNVTLLVSTATGQATATYDYGPFGEPLRESGEYAKINQYRVSTKYTDDETGLVDYGRRYYGALDGRWKSRDPIEEEGGVNLYGFVNNDSVNRLDYLGMDFIAAGSLPLENFIGIIGGPGLPANHASVEYFKESGSQSASLNQQFTVPPTGAVRQSTIELLQYPNKKRLLPYGWARKGWRTGPNGKRRFERWIVKVGISGISFENGLAKRFIVVKPCATNVDWQQIKENAKKYYYAEDFRSLTSGGALSKWPNSRYDLPPNGNNSNSFVRFMLKQVDIAIAEPFLNTFEHPGAYFPSPIFDERSVPSYNPHW